MKRITKTSKIIEEFDSNENLVKRTTETEEITEEDVPSQKKNPIAPGISPSTPWPSTPGISPWSPWTSQINIVNPKDLPYRVINYATKP